LIRYFSITSPVVEASPEIELTGKVYKEALKYLEKTERSAREAFPL
jgi:hypothetical protein